MNARCSLIQAVPQAACLGTAVSAFHAATAPRWDGTTQADATIDPVDARDVELSLGGDGDAFTRLVQRHQARVARQMWRFTRNPEDHAELIQEVFVNAFAGLRSYRGQGDFSHWLQKIAVRTGYAYWRRNRKRAEPSENVTAILDLQEQQEAPDETVIAATAVHQILELLPARDRMVLTLLYLDERSVAEIADLTGWSQSMVKVQAWRARRKLAQLLSATPE